MHSRIVTTLLLACAACATDDASDTPSAYTTPTPVEAGSAARPTAAGAPAGMGGAAAGTGGAGMGGSAAGTGGLAAAGHGGAGSSAAGAGGASVAGSPAAPKDVVCAAESSTYSCAAMKADGKTILWAVQSNGSTQRYSCDIPGSGCPTGAACSIYRPTDNGLAWQGITGTCL